MGVAYSLRFFRVPRPSKHLLTHPNGKVDMAKMAELWAKDMENEILGIERLIVAAAERAGSIQTDPLLNGQKQSVAALKNHLLKLAEDAATLRKGFRPTSPDIKESVDVELVGALKSRNGAGSEDEENENGTKKSAAGAAN